MAASRQDVDQWIERAKAQDKKYIISVCDTFDHEDYPSYCTTAKMCRDKYNAYDNKNMQRVNEIIRINDDGTVDENLRITDI